VQCVIASGNSPTIRPCSENGGSRLTPPRTIAFPCKPSHSPVTPRFSLSIARTLALARHEPPGAHRASRNILQRGRGSQGAGGAVARIRHVMTRCCPVHLELPHDRHPNAARGALPAAAGAARRHGGIDIPSRLRPQLIFAVRACARPARCHNVAFFQCNNAPQDALLLDIGCGRCVQPPNYRTERL
jgi:hypothetical protein